MARPKGSKNKTRIVNANVDYAAVVAEKTAEKEKIESEVAALTANLDDLKTQLKAKKAELKGHRVGPCNSVPTGARPLAVCATPHP